MEGWDDTRLGRIRATKGLPAAWLVLIAVSLVAWAGMGWAVYWLMTL